MNTWRRLALVLAVAAAVIVIIGCSDAKKTAPGGERDTGGSPSRPGAVEILSVSGGSGSAPISVAAAAAAPGAPAAGLTVRHSQSATVAADVAFVSVFLAPGSGFGPGGPQPVSAKDQAAVVAALAAQGIARTDISFEANFNFGPFAEVAVKVGVGDLKTKGQPIVDAIEKVLGRAQSSGARFGLTSCTAALNPIRKAGFTAAEEKAKSLAAAGGLTLGAVVAVAEGTTPNIFGPPVSDPCSPQAGNAKFPGSALGFDAPAEVKVSLDIVVTYALGSSGDGSGITVVATGSATAKADEAYVVVFANQNGPNGPRPIASKDRDALVAKLVALGIKAEDVKIEASNFGGPTIISAEVDLTKLPKIGEDVLEAVGSVLGRNTQQQGVRFTHSNCQVVLNAAHKQALTDAEPRAKTLAEAAGLKLGALQSVSDGGSQPTPYGPSLDPCSKDLSLLLQGGGYGGALKPFDSPAELKVSSALTVTYSLAR